MKLFILCVALIAAAAVRADDDWDELEGILDNLEEVDKKTFTDDDDDGSDEEIVDHKGASNPCQSHVCGWGKVCEVTKSGKPSCECIKECPTIVNPDPYDKVCSSKNETFSSLCELYKARCDCKRGNKACKNKAVAKSHLEYLGACKELDVCTDDLMLQFPDRMSDWLFQVMKDLKTRKALHGDKWKSMLTEAQEDDHLRRVYPVIWKFCDLDRQPNDMSVTHHELIPITAPVIPMESCIKPFLEKCDSSGDGQITLAEWGTCLGVEHDEIQEQC